MLLVYGTWEILNLVSKVSLKTLLGLWCWEDSAQSTQALWSSPGPISEADQRVLASGNKTSVAAKMCSDYLWSEHLQSWEAAGNCQSLVVPGRIQLFLSETKRTAACCGSAVPSSVAIRLGRLSGALGNFTHKCRVSASEPPDVSAGSPLLSDRRIKAALEPDLGFN